MIPISHIRLAAVIKFPIVFIEVGMVKFPLAFKLPVKYLDIYSFTLGKAENKDQKPAFSHRIPIGHEHISHGSHSPTAYFWPAFNRPDFCLAASNSTPVSFHARGVMSHSLSFYRQFFVI